MWLVAGTIPIATEDPSQVAAACLVLDATGRTVARYDKIHLFDVSIPGRDERYMESGTVRRGSEPVCIDTPAGRLGLAVCYDVRFPELFRAARTRRRRLVLPAVRLYGAHRPRALGSAAAGARHREPGRHGGAGAVRIPRKRP